MIERDVVVGIVAIGLGIVLLTNLWLRRNRPASLSSMRMIEETLGPIGSKVFIGLLGVSLTAMGVYLMVKLPSSNPAPMQDSNQPTTPENESTI